MPFRIKGCSTKSPMWKCASMGPGALCYVCDLWVEGGWLQADWVSPLRSGLFANFMKQYESKVQLYWVDKQMRIALRCLPVTNDGWPLPPFMIPYPYFWSPGLHQPRWPGVWGVPTLPTPKCMRLRIHFLINGQYAANTAKNISYQLV